MCHSRHRPEETGLCLPLFLCHFKPGAVSARHQHAEERLSGSKPHGPQPGPEEHDQPQVGLYTRRPQYKPAHQPVTAGIIRFLCFRLPSLVEYVEQPLTAGLKDRAACVRRVAVLGWAKLHNLQPSSEIGRVDEWRSPFSFSVPLLSCLSVLVFSYIFSGV